MDTRRVVIGIAIGILLSVVYLLLRYGAGSGGSVRRIERSDTGDPMVDADRRMAFGHYENAAKLLRSAILQDPERNELKLKLLEVYFIWGKKAEFSDAAEKYKSDLQADWDRVTTMRQSLEL